MLWWHFNTPSPERAPRCAMNPCDVTDCPILTDLRFYAVLTPRRWDFLNVGVSASSGV